MRLISFARDDRVALGACVGDSCSEVVDLTLAASVRDGETPSMLVGLRSFLEAGDEARAFAEQLIVWATEYRGTISGPDGDDYQLVRPLDGLKLTAPITDPSKIIAIGLNYRDHAEEQGAVLPRSPITFAKFNNTLVGHLGEIEHPTITRRLDYEAELAVVVGRGGKHIPEKDALRHVAGYACYNDVSARDFQGWDKQWFRGKNCDRFGPMGPFFVTADEIDDPHDLNIKLWVNDDLRQNSNTSQLYFNVPTLVSFVSSFCTLEIGDVIATGTPGGVGYTMKPPQYLKPGDTMTVEIEGLGRLKNTIVEPHKN